MQELKDGILTIYKKEKTESVGGMPVESVKRYAKAWFAYLNFSVTEFYAKKQDSDKVEKRVRILQDKAISTNNHVIVIDKTQYEVGRIFHAASKDGRPITDISLERVTRQYDIS